MHAYTLCDFHRDPLGLEWRALVLTYTVRGSQVASAFGSLSSHWSRAGMKTEKCCRVSESLKTLQGVELESLSASTTTATVCPSLYSRVHFRTAHARRHRANNSARILYPPRENVGVNSVIELINEIG